MNNKMINLLTVIVGILLMSPPSFAGSEPLPSPKPVDLTPAITKVKLNVAPAVGVCGGGVLLPYSGVDCYFGDITIAGTCAGLPVIAALRGWDMSLLFGLNVPVEDLADITKKGLLGRVLTGIGFQLAIQNPGLDSIVCPVDGRNYEIRRVKGFVNNAGVISAEIHLVPVL